MVFKALDPRDHGVDMDKDDFVDILVEELATMFRGMWTVDELCLHPREAMRFCDDVRLRNGFFSAPDDFILRCLMNRRKNPSG